MTKRTYNYQGTFDSTRMARAFSSNVPISRKFSSEVCRTIKGKMVNDAAKLLENVSKMETHLPLMIYNKEVPHRKGNATGNTKAGRYPVRVVKAWLKLLNSVKHNADVKGLNMDKLKIVHANASMGFSRQGSQSQGRISGKQRKAKSAHIEVIVAEVKA